MTVQDLPAFNAFLNGTSALLVCTGLMLIRRGHATAHRYCMTAAVVVSGLFLVSYLYYHAHAGRTVFREPAEFRPVYLIILFTHTVLAVAIVPMVLTTVVLAWRRHWERHRRWARWTWPLWLYVSVTGVLIYLLLYHIFPQNPVS
ncbi:MAG: DUF420 domain-containing protein [Verrucomicrobiota bacterium]|nr:DUF420 domain-containing protein [Limisphaera sp.]MDW8382175.1 DUF420 domain-containing protein [Verrucomicrobiota bacterium]